MAANSGIQWTTHTFNPWRGCTKISAGCTHCYAETLGKRNQKVLGKWGRDGTRVIAAEARWREVIGWNLEAENQPNGRPRVFCASLADVFEGADTMPPAAGTAVFGARMRLLETIEKTPALDWLLLTKRPENVLDQIGQRWKIGGAGIPRNVWMGTTVEDRAALARVDVLRSIPAAVRFLSCEPLLEDVGKMNLEGIGWVIVGGESGGGARPFNLTWARSIVKQCKAAKVPVFVKQMGSNPVDAGSANAPGMLSLKLRGKGGDLEEWPAELRIREFPKPLEELAA